MRKALIGLPVVVALVSMAPAAHAAFPGANGRIAFTSDRTGNNEVFVMFSDGTGQTNLTNNPSESDSAPAWSPDGAQIAFTRDPASGGTRHQIYVMNADGSAQTRTSPIDVWEHDNAAWSPDGTKIAADANTDPPVGLRDIVVFNEDGTGTVNLTSDNGGPDIEPAWSPDGERIAFASQRGAGSQDIYIMGADGSSPVEVTNGLGSESHPTWSPDGIRIAFTRTICNPQCDTSINVLDVLNGGETQITSGVPPDAEPVWSPAGSKIAFTRIVSPGSDRQVLTMNPDGTSPATLASSAGQDDRPDWQPIANGYPRPKGATPMLTSLVVAYPQCTSPDRTHGPPLAFPSCASPTPVSPNVRVGNPADGTGAAARMAGNVRFDALPGAAGAPDDSDVGLKAWISDVRCTERNINIYPFPCGAPNAQQENDYIGELLVSIAARATDTWNAGTEGGGSDSATVDDFPFDFVLNCEATPPDVGSTCSAYTSFNAILPGTVLDAKRAIWQLGQVRVFDTGPDGNVVTADGQELFAVQGVFVP